MSDSKLESVLKALLAVLQSGSPPGVKILRNEPLPQRIPKKGMLILRDGDPGQPDQEFSPPVYIYQHRAEIEVLAQNNNTGDRDAMFDTLRQAIALAINADLTLGGECEYVEVEASQPQDVDVAGGDTIKGATIPVILHFETSNPLT